MFDSICRSYILKSAVLYYYLQYCYTTANSIEEPNTVNPTQYIIMTETYGNTTQIEDQIEEEWLNQGVRDVAYYLRSHKFNEYDRRYWNEQDAKKEYYKAFPAPALLRLHWEVDKYCSQGFTQCVGYLRENAGRGYIHRSIDTATVINQRGWQLPRNLKAIESVNSECIRLRKKDWNKPKHFRDALERFQWRTSASYYMCWYTMQEKSSLALFGERCDNFAFCVDATHYVSKNNDPRADDRLPYQCALYSFCPDPCCPKRLINVYEECREHEQNPCVRENPYNRNECSYQRKNNRRLEGIVLNHWNVSCHCEPGFVWESRFGMCVDVDECALDNTLCDNLLEVCINLQGKYVCTCAWGYEWLGNGCKPSISLMQSVSNYNQKNKPIKPTNFSISLHESDDEMKYTNFNNGLLSS